MHIIVLFLKHMFQKQNDLLIVNALIGGEGHVRHLAHITGLSPSTIARIVNELSLKGVVDFREEGKNKICFLKRTPEAEAFIFMAEHYRRFLFLKNDHLRRLVKQILSITSEELVIIFGSQVRGDATAESDVDIYVETEDSNLRNRLQNLFKSLSVKIGHFDKESPLGKEIIKNHVILRGVERFYQLIK